MVRWVVRAVCRIGKRGRKSVPGRGDNIGESMRVGGVVRVTDVRVLLLIEKKKKKGIGTENRNRGEMNSYLVMGRGVS